MFIDQYTGQVLWSRTAREAPTGWRYVKEWNREIHTGDIFGIPTRILASIASLMLVLQLATGVVMWWKRRS